MGFVQAASVLVKKTTALVGRLRELGIWMPEGLTQADAYS